MFKKGQIVWVKSLGAKGTIKEIHGSKFSVQMERLVAQCAESDLSVDKPKGMKKSKYKITPKHHPALKPVKDKRKLESIDLHGMTVVEAIAAVEKRVNDAILADLDRLEIVHGVGTGALLKAVHQYLSGLSVVERFRLDDQNPGCTFVYF